MHEMNFKEDPYHNMHMNTFGSRSHQYQLPFAEKTAISMPTNRNPCLQRGEKSLHSSVQLIRDKTSSEQSISCCSKTEAFVSGESPSELKEMCQFHEVRVSAVLSAELLEILGDCVCGSVSHSVSVSVQLVSVLDALAVIQEVLQAWCRRNERRQRERETKPPLCSDAAFIHRRGQQQTLRDRKSTVPYPAGKPWKTAGKSLMVSTSLQSRCSSTPPGPCCMPFRWNSSRCCWPSASTRLLKVTEVILLSLRSLKEVRMKASFTPCSTSPPCRRSGRQSGDVSRSYTVEEKGETHMCNGGSDQQDTQSFICHQTETLQAVFGGFGSQIDLRAGRCDSHHDEMILKGSFSAAAVPCSGFFNDRCYKYIATHLTWAESELQCLSEGANLVSIHSQAENEFVRSLIKNFDPAERSTWIGLSDLHKEGSWLWSDGCLEKFVFWDAGQPDNGLGKEHCVDINYVEKPFSSPPIKGLYCSNSMMDVSRLRSELLANRWTERQRFRGPKGFPVTKKKEEGGRRQRALLLRVLEHKLSAETTRIEKKR
ncbi:hypothetical protein F7725_015139 [Dissostichus mawsoni]|uniref:C-type lectin domain-containing protein n=1 Tax=Dissostichus mawsoni TaxID=36200 RepID=A0A7J5YGL3_DISMA|nr:hypothetical protein F7725_015139 [Dissostichus mawsoni]